MAFSDVDLLARLIQCEAGGEGETGMKAAAGTIMNRVNAPGGEYARVSQGGSLRNIAFQERQFECVTENSNQNGGQNIYNMRPEQMHYDIAEWALAGNRLPGLGESLWFYNPYSSQCRQNFPSNSGYLVDKINNHCFYSPSQQYFNT